jgi:DNA-binding transcriptional LysR family regulator
VDTLLSLQVFQAVSSSKSFSSAAEQLGISAAMATKHVQNLESRVGARLLNRTSRKVSLTEAGEIYLARVGSLLEGLHEAEMVVGESTQAPRGVLSISLPVWMTTPNFVKLLAQYHSAYPEVQLKLDPSAGFVNLVEGRYDLALRVGDYGDEGLIARKLSEVQFFAVASPDFLSKRGRPQSIEDLNGIPYLAYSRKTSGDHIRYKDEEQDWEFSVNPVIKSENEILILLSALEGMGAAILPHWLVAEHIASGRLERILENEICVRVPFYALYPDRNYLPAKTRSFIDFMLKPETLAQM